MGMYTELLLKCDVKSDLEPLVEDVLQYLFNGKDKPDMLPNHSFFQCSRWEMIGRCSSYYHTPWSDSRYDEGYIFSRSDLKNYDDEIDKFIDWLMPYLSEYDGRCIGHKWYEEFDEPTLIYYRY